MGILLEKGFVFSRPQAEDVPAPVGDEIFTVLGFEHRPETKSRRLRAKVPTSCELQESSEVVLWGLEVDVDLNGQRGTCHLRHSFF